MRLTIQVSEPATHPLLRSNRNESYFNLLFYTRSQEKIKATYLSHLDSDTPGQSKK